MNLSFPVDGGGGGRLSGGAGENLVPVALSGDRPCRLPDRAASAVRAGDGEGLGESAGVGMTTFLGLTRWPARSVVPGPAVQGERSESAGHEAQRSALDRRPGDNTLPRRVRPSTEPGRSAGDRHLGARVSRLPAEGARSSWPPNGVV